MPSLPVIGQRTGVTLTCRQRSLRGKISSIYAVSVASNASGRPRPYVNAFGCDYNRARASVLARIAGIRGLGETLKLEAIFSSCFIILVTSAGFALSSELSRLATTNANS